MAAGSTVSAITDKFEISDDVSDPDSDNSLFFFNPFKSSGDVNSLFFVLEEQIGVDVAFITRGLQNIIIILCY